MGTAFEDLAGVDVGDTLFVGDPWKIDREGPFSVVHQTGRAQQKYRFFNVPLTFVGDLKEQRRRRNC